MSLLITIPVFGQHEYTHALVGDLEREGAEYLIVDNRGDYPKISNERVTTPDENLGWAGGSDLGFRIAFSEGYSHAMTLNNDTRISKGFVAALLDTRLPADAGIVGPMIDHGFRYAVADEKPDAADYSPCPLYRAVPAVEGTALMLSYECWQADTCRRKSWRDERLMSRMPICPIPCGRSWKANGLSTDRRRSISVSAGFARRRQRACPRSRRCCRICEIPSRHFFLCRRLPDCGGL